MKMSVKDKSRNRQFYSLDSEVLVPFSKQPVENKIGILINAINTNAIGKDTVFNGPFGPRKVLYLDYTASGQSISFLEDYIQREVLPEYGNTHTTTSVTALQTTMFRHEARDIIRNAVNASEHDAVIFVGSGCTGAVHKLIHVLNLQQAPVVFVGPYEHHSNLLPWRELGAKSGTFSILLVVGIMKGKGKWSQGKVVSFFKSMITIQETSDGLVDITHLKLELQKWSKTGRQLIGCFSAASNITGILVDVDQITVCLHKHGALAFWDYATAGPYVKIDMNPVIASTDYPYVYKDAMFLSVHKFPGGVSTPGLLVAKKTLFRHSVPESAGGGSVFFVHGEGHRYLQEAEMREEGGTPAIVGSIRAGLVFQLKEAVGTEEIMRRERYLCRKALDSWRDLRHLVLLGNTDVERLPVFSFLVYHADSGLFLHYNYVTALLNDLFGIQARGGCACAGPYAQSLLGMDDKLAKEYESLLAEDSRLDRVHLRRYGEYSDREMLRPGFTRINLPYFMSDDELEFVLKAISLVAEQGWKLLPRYMFNPQTGEWRARHHQVFKDRKWLGHISYSSGKMTYKDPFQLKGTLPSSFHACLSEAQDLFNKANKMCPSLPDHSVMFDAESTPYRWFLLPSESAAYLRKDKPAHRGANFTDITQSTLPFIPPALRLKFTVCTKYDGSGIIDSQSCSSENECGSLKNTSLSSSHEPYVIAKQSPELNSDTKNEFTNTTSYPSKNDNLPPSDSAILTGSKEEFSDGLVKHFETGFCNSGVTPIPSCSSNNTSSEPVSVQSIALTHDSTDNSVVNIVTSDQQEMETNLVWNTGNVSSPVYNKNTGHCDNHDGTCDSDNHDGACDSDNHDGACDSENHDTHNLPPESCNNDMMSSGHTAVLEKHYHVQTDRQTHTLEQQYTSQSVQVSVDSKQSNVATIIDVCLDGCETSHDRTSKDDSSIVLSTSGPVNPAFTNEGSALVNNAVVDQCSADSSTITVADLDVNRLEKSSRGTCFLKKGATVSPNTKVKWHSPWKKIFKPFIEAVEEFEMFKSNDRVLVCLSGGKDSLSLLHAVRQYQFYAKKKGIDFEFGAVTVDPQTPSYDPSPLKQYLAQLDVPYFFESQDIMGSAANLPYECASICSFCSRMKRGRIYACARRERYNVLALGQHLDDLAESFLMSLFHNGSLRTMKAHYTVQEGDLRVIRPFVYVRETDLRAFAEQSKLPVIAENCPACFEAPKERHRVKQLLASQEIMFPQIYHSMRAAMHPILSIDQTGVNIHSLLTQKHSISEDTRHNSESDD